jgi:hypothetical protein
MGTTKIWERLYLGSLNDAAQLAVENPFGITAVVSLCSHRVPREAMGVSYAHALAFCYYSYMKLMWHGEEIDLPDIGHEDARKLQELIALNKQDEVEALLTKLRVIDSKDAA